MSYELGKRLSGLPEWEVWRSMRRRCYDPKTHGFEHYGGRGIRVCERWLGPVGFPNFLNDMGRRPGDRHSIDRTNNNGNYEPTNCRWVELVVQNNNKRTNHILTFRGESKTVAMRARQLGMSRITIESRLRDGWTVDRALTEPRDPQERNLTFRGKTQSLREWAIECGIGASALWSRIDRDGWTIEEALTTPILRSQKDRRNPRLHLNKAVRMLTANGRTQPLRDWARELGISEQALSGRISSGWPIERALSAPRIESHVPTRFNGTQLPNLTNLIP